MFKKVVYLIVSCCLFFSASSFGQGNDDVEKQRAEYEKKAYEDLNEAILRFTNDLDADDFQKEILKQKLGTYYTAKIAIYKDLTLKSYQRDEILLKLDTSHFSDISNMFSEDIMNKVQVFIKDGGQTLEKQKKKKRKKKN